MRLNIRQLLFTVLMMALTASANASDLKLWYDKPASVWNQALPIGNGRLAAMYFGDPSNDRLQLNESTFWSGGPSRNDNTKAKSVLNNLRSLIFNGQYSNVESIVNANITAAQNHGSMYQTIGYLNLAFTGQNNYSNYRRELDLDRAVLTTTYDVDGVSFKREVFASQPDQVIIMRLSASENGKISFTVGLDGALKKVSKATSTTTLEMTGQSSDHEGVTGKVYFDARTQIKTDGGTTSISSNNIVVKGANEVVIYISIATNFTDYLSLTTSQATKCANFMASAVKKDYNTLLTDHIVSYQKYFNRVNLDLGSTSESEFPTDSRIANFASCYDPQLVTMLYQFGRYLLISSSQPGGQASTLQGLWNDSSNPVWDSKYTININTEMNYWPAEKCNMSEMHEPLIAMIKDLSVAGQKTATDMYGCRGWVCHHNTDIWRVCGVIDMASSGMWPMGSAWLSQHLWERYLYNGDLAYLDSVYPILKSACEFYRDFLVVDPKTKYLEVCPSLSPEHTPYNYSPTSVNTGVTMDNQLLFDLFGKTIKAASLLKRDSAEMATFKTAMDSLPPMRIGKYGQLQEWKDDWDDPTDTHRHVSHLYGLFPSSQISPYSSPKLASAAKTSLVERGDASTGWSMGWKINLWARLLDGNHAYKLITDQLTLVDPVNSGDNGGTYPNFFDAHPPFQIDGNFGCTSGITEMLLQSYDGSIFLMPAMPDKWKAAGSITGLRAYGGFEVSYTWKDGEVESATVKSTLGGNCRLRLPNTMVLSGGVMKVATGTNPNDLFATPTPKTPIINSSAKITNPTLATTYLYDIDTKAGDVYTLMNKKLAIKSAVITDSASDKITLEFTQPVALADSSRGFSVKVDGKAMEISKLSKGDVNNKVVISLPNTVGNSQAVVVSYTNGNIVSDNNQPMRNFTNIQVENLIKGSSPLLQSAVTSQNGDTLLLAFNKKMSLPSDLSALTLYATYNQQLKLSATSCRFTSEGDSTRISLILSQSVYNEYTLKLTTTAATFKSYDNGSLGLLSSYAVVNKSLGMPLTLSSAILSTNNTTITLTFNKRVAMAYELKKDFSVKVNGSEIEPTDVSISGKTIVITMPNKLRYGNEVKISYTQDSLHAIDGGILQSFSDKNVNIATPASVKIPAKVEAESYTDMYGVQQETAEDTGGTQDLCFIDDGDWTEYIVNNTTSDTNFDLTLRMSSPYGNGLVTVNVDDKKVVQIPITQTSGWQVYGNNTASVVIPSGIHYVTLIYTKGSTNINYLIFSSKTSDVNTVMTDAGNVNVYSTSGVNLKQNVKRSTWSQGLTKGIYIVDKKKVVK